MTTDAPPHLVAAGANVMAARESPTRRNGLKGETTLAPSGANAWGESTMPADDDLQLVARMQDADAAALAALYDRYASAVHGLTRAILRDDRLAEEATHDVFLGVWQDPGAYQPARGAFAAWLLRVARNRAIDLLRRKREQPFAATVVAETGQALDPATLLVDPDPDPAEQATSRLVGQDVRRALASLTPDHQRLLEMAYFGGMTQREIAAAVNRPLGTVKTQIRTAMQRMAHLLIAEGANPDGHWPHGIDQPPSYEMTSGGEVESR
jgi:RNA polymerase sigma-70 factor (ECF subfamily)